MCCYNEISQAFHPHTNLKDIKEALRINLKYVMLKSFKV